MKNIVWIDARMDQRRMRASQDHILNSADLLWRVVMVTMGIFMGRIHGVVHPKRRFDPNIGFADVRDKEINQPVIAARQLR